MRSTDTGFEPEALKKLIQSGNVPYTENSVSYIFTCPLCEKPKKLYIRKRDGRFVCWKCAETENFKGRAEYALRELYGQPIAELRSLLYGDKLAYEEGSALTLHLRDFYGDEDEEPEEEVTLPPLQWPLDYFPLDTPQGARGRKYVEQRGITLVTAQKYDLRYCPPTQRVAIPVYVGGVLRGWQARYIRPTVTYTEDGRKLEALKILSTEGLTGGGALMFQDNLRGSPHCVLCEGPFDALKADLCGGNVASMGKAVTHRQLGVIARSGVRRLYVAFDPDAAGDVMRVARDMWDMELYYMEPPEGRADFGDCTFEETLHAFRNAERFTPSRLFIYTELPRWMQR